MSWSLITNEWRLKLLAFLLAVLMLGAVAFSQNRPTSKTFQVGLNYTVPSGPNGPNIVLLNPPSKTFVTVAGLSDAIDKVDPNSSLIATADATGAKPGSGVKINVTARSLVPGVTVPQNPAPIAVNIDTFQYVDLAVQVIARPATGWRIDAKNTHATCPGANHPSPCWVHFGGPVSWESGLKAVATVPGFVTGQGDYLNLPIQLQTPSGSLDQSLRTVPSATMDVTSADVHVEAIAGSTSESVPLLDSPPTHGPPAGYRITAVTITPQLVTVTGDATVLQRITAIPLPAVDLSSSTSDATFQVAITYPNGVTGSVATVTLKYSISRNPNVTPSPGG